MSVDVVTAYNSTLYHFVCLCVKAEKQHMSRQMVHSVVRTTKKTDQVANKQLHFHLKFLGNSLCLSEIPT